MGLLDRLRAAEAGRDAQLPERTVAGGTLLLQNLGQNGFGLRDPETGLPLRADGSELADLGAFVVLLDGIAERRDAARCLASSPGQTLTLVPDGHDVIVYDHYERHDIGEIPAEIAPALAAAMREGATYRALSLWEVKALDGSRTELRVLIVPSDVEVILAIEAPDLIVVDDDGDGDGDAVT